MGLSIRCETQTPSSFVKVLDSPLTLQELPPQITSTFLPLLVSTFFFCPSSNCTLNLEIFITIIVALRSQEERRISLLHIRSIFTV